VEGSSLSAHEEKAEGLEFKLGSGCRKGRHDKQRKRNKRVNPSSFTLLQQQLVVGARELACELRSLYQGKVSDHS
jgi:hypothetical protein